MDNYLPSIISFGIAIIGLFCGIISFLSVGYIKHVDGCIETLFKKIDAEAKAREVRWNTLHAACNNCIADIGYLKGQLKYSKQKEK